uniref:Reverse transcriptase domain-containing protein n=1 Tax=Tanacetum cinerariifolium TaxID=118510 RepID=A0A699SC51_TANCI|nr:reverse transcriptase domain-containing protein [Tanacetum cinerariifolium]
MARLGEGNKNWEEELPHVLWAYRTMIKSSHGSAVWPSSQEISFTAAMTLVMQYSHAVAGGKLGPKWEGPYEVIDVLGNGAYKLRSTDGTLLPRTWNVTNLKRCYL